MAGVIRQRQPRYVDKSLTRLARGMPCMFTFPHDCGGDVMACHNNWQEWGKGVGLKCSDFLWAAGCLTAHREIDGKINPAMTKEERMHQWLMAYIATWDYLWRSELVKVA